MRSFNSMAGAGMQSSLFSGNKGSVSRPTSMQFLISRTFTSKDEVEHKEKGSKEHHEDNSEKEHKESMKELIHFAKKVKKDSKLLHGIVLLFLGVVLATVSALPERISSTDKENIAISAGVKECNVKLTTLEEKISDLEATLEELRASRAAAEADMPPPPLAGDSPDSSSSQP